MRVLITGGAGYIGSQTAKHLAAAGHEAVVLDNLSTGHSWAVRWGPLVAGDLANKDLIRATLVSEYIEAVVHFAAHTYVGESRQQPGQYFRNNVCGTLNLLDAMVEVGVPSIVFSSTCATYGLPRRTPIAEDHPQQPINPYGESKLFAERALRWYGEAHDLRWCALRYFNAAGADPDGEIGEDHDPEPHLIPSVIGTALGLRPEVALFGTDFDTADGTAIRDYVHVADLADAHVRAVDLLARGEPSMALNLGTGQGYSVRQVVETVGRVSGRKVPSRNAPRRAGDPAVLVADALLAARTLGWHPQFRSLDAIVETAWRWHRSRALGVITPLSAPIVRARPKRAGLRLVGHGVDGLSKP